jgi:hypothetical protein
MKQVITVTLLLLFNLQFFAQSKLQPCFIVKNQADTIIGEGSVSKNQKYCLFKALDAEKSETIYPDKIDAIRIINGSNYVSKKIEEPNGDTTMYFLEFLVDGEVDLFTISKAGRYFLMKENGDMLELIYTRDNIIEQEGRKYLVQDKKYLGYLRSFMSDAPELFPEIDKMEILNQRNLVDLSVDYHNAICEEYPCVDYTKKIPKITYKLELLTGATKHNAYYSPQYGILVHVWSPLRNEKLYVKAGIIYSEKTYNRKSGNDTESKDYSLKFPISLQYVFGQGRLKPTVALGFPTGIFLISSVQGGFIYSFTEKFEIALNASLDGLLAFPAGLHEEIFDNNFGHSIGFGLIYQIK